MKPVLTNNEETIISELSKLGSEDEAWLYLIHSILVDDIPNISIRNTKNSVEDFLIYIDVVLQVNLRLKNLYHKKLSLYYRSIAHPQLQTKELSALHWIFTAIKIIDVDLIKYMEKLLFQKKFLELEYTPNLHVSLLSFLSATPISNKKKISGHLLSMKERHMPGAFYNVANRFFQKNCSPHDARVYVTKLFYQAENPPMDEVFFLTALDSRNLNGSFIEFYEWIDENMRLLTSSQYSGSSEAVRRRFMRYLSESTESDLKSDYYLKLIIPLLNVHFIALPLDIIEFLLKMPLIETLKAKNPVVKILKYNFDRHSDIYRFSGKDIPTISYRNEEDRSVEIEIMVSHYNYYYNQILGSKHLFETVKGSIRIPPKPEYEKVFESQFIRPIEMRTS